MATLAEDPDRRRVWVLLIAGFMVIVLGFVAVISVQAVIADKTDDLKLETILNRSVTCRVILGQGQRVSNGGPCLRKNVLEHYDPVNVCERLKRSDPTNTCAVEL